MYKGIINSPKTWTKPGSKPEPEEEEDDTQYSVYGYTFKPYTAPGKEETARKADAKRRSDSLKRAYRKVDGTPL